MRGLRLTLSHPFYLKVLKKDYLNMHILVSSSIIKYCNLYNLNKYLKYLWHRLKVYIISLVEIQINNDLLDLS